MAADQTTPGTTFGSVGVSVVTGTSPVVLDNAGAGDAITSSSPLDADPAQVLAALDGTNLGFTGVGITVGVISDSFDNLGGAAADEQDGALPPASQINVLEDDPSGGTDEGRAMMQVVHDVAPGANLDFYTADISEQDFANGILALAQAGCKVICDDVSYLDEPFFQTGVIAQAIQTVEQEGVVVLTAAGNEGEEGYQSSWNEITRTRFDGTTLIDAQNFGNNSPVQTITIGSAAGDTIWELQWNQPFGAATTDIGVLVFQNGSLVGEFSNVNFGNFTESTFDPGADDPLVALDLSSGTYQIAIEDLSGPNPGEIKDVLFANGTEPYVSLGDANAGTVLGHHASPDAITVGAVDSANTPTNGGTLQSEYYSSSGAGTQLDFNYDGTPVVNGPLNLSPVAVSGVDDIQTTLPNGLDDFFGTSCATPSVAGVVADMLQADPDLTPAEVESILELSATSFGNSSVAGSGLVNATLAIAGTQIYQIYQQALGRVPDTQGLVYWLQEFSDGISLASIQQAIASSSEAEADIIGMYQQILSRTPVSTEITFWQNLLVDGSSLSAVRSGIALSSEAASDIRALYEQVLGRPADTNGVVFFQIQMADGATLADARIAMAQSPEATADIVSFYQQILDRTPANDEINFWESVLNGSADFAQVHSAIAFSVEAAADIQAIFVQVVGQTASASQIASLQAQLAIGGSLAGVRVQLATSAAAQNSLAAAYQAAYGRVSNQNVLTDLTNQLATSSATLQQVTNALQNPLIIDTVAGQAITDQSTDQLFAAVMVSDPRSGVTETATITLLNSNGIATDADGSLSGAGLVHTGAGTYTLSNSSAAGLTAELNVLVFTPTQGQVPTGQSVTTAVTLSVENANGNTGTDTTTSITAQAVSASSNLNFLYGSIGSDMFSLANGADVVAENVNPLGNDVVNGFNLAQDIVQLSAAQFANFAAVQSSLTLSGGNAVLAFDSSDSLTLVGINPNNLTAANFRFV